MTALSALYKRLEFGVVFPFIRLAQSRLLLSQHFREDAKSLLSDFGINVHRREQP